MTFSGGAMAAVGQGADGGDQGTGTGVGQATDHGAGTGWTANWEPLANVDRFADWEPLASVGQTTNRVAGTF